MKLRIEQVTGIPPPDQQLFVTTPQDKKPLEDGTKLPDYFPDVVSAHLLLSRSFGRLALTIVWALAAQPFGAGPGGQGP